MGSADPDALNAGPPFERALADAEGAAGAPLRSPGAPEPRALWTGCPLAPAEGAASPLHAAATRRPQTTRGSGERAAMRRGLSRKRSGSPEVDRGERVDQVEQVEDVRIACVRADCD